MTVIMVNGNENTVMGQWYAYTCVLLYYIVYKGSDTI